MSGRSQEWLTKGKNRAARPASVVYRRMFYDPTRQTAAVSPARPGRLGTRLEYKHSFRNLHSLRRSFLTEIIATKAIVRPNRFFGEALVAGDWGYEDAWYSSYQWLTSEIWTDGRGPQDDYHRKFKSALKHHFPKLKELQQRLTSLESQLGIKPAAPDLWLIRGDEHWFTEVKILPKDDVADSQLAGLAVISECLPSSRPVHVSVVYLQEQLTDLRAKEADLQRRFEAYCNKLRQPRQAV